MQGKKPNDAVSRLTSRQHSVSMCLTNDFIPPLKMTGIDDEARIKELDKLAKLEKENLAMKRKLVKAAKAKGDALINPHIYSCCSEHSLKPQWQFPIVAMTLNLRMNPPQRRRCRRRFHHRYAITANNYKYYRDFIF
jgi:hypothetical protein